MSLTVMTTMVALFAATATATALFAVCFTE
jgi:hypothetical protein